MEMEPLVDGDEEAVINPHDLLPIPDSPEEENSDSEVEKDHEDTFVKLNNYSLSDMEMDFHDIVEHGERECCPNV